MKKILMSVCLLTLSVPMYSSGMMRASSYDSSYEIGVAYKKGVVQREINSIYNPGGDPLLEKCLSDIVEYSATHRDIDRKTLIDMTLAGYNKSKEDGTDFQEAIDSAIAAYNRTRKKGFWETYGCGLFSTKPTFAESISWIAKRNIEAEKIEVERRRRRDEDIQRTEIARRVRQYQQYVNSRKPATI